MKGYVQNKSSVWTHVMKRAVGPGQQIPLEELYEQYGKKHGLSEGEEFIGWLREVKLRDADKWRVVVEKEESIQPVKEAVFNEATEKTEPKPKEEEPNVNVVRPPEAGGNVTPIVSKGMEVEDVVQLSVRKARELVPRIRDLNLLKYALQEANQRANKDSLCQILRKRIKEIQIAR
jgi:hypothetical protein